MDVFSNLMVIGECLLDRRRTQAFQKAIQTCLKPGMVGLDIGTGSGILAMMMARAGASKVYAVDIADDIAHFARRNVHQNKLDGIVEVIVGDAKTLTKIPPVDILTMELMDTGMVGEQQAPVMNTLLDSGIVTKSTTLIPYRYQCVATLIEYDFNFYGFSMPFVIQARNFEVRKKIIRKLTHRSIYADVFFHEKINTHVDITMQIPVTTDGRINALLLESRTYLAPGHSIWGTTDLNMPVVIPLPATVVRMGEIKNVHIDYRMAEGFDKFDAAIL